MELSLLHFGHRIESPPLYGSQLGELDDVAQDQDSIGEEQEPVCRCLSSEVVEQAGQQKQKRSDHYQLGHLLHILRSRWSKIHSGLAAHQIALSSAVLPRPVSIIASSRASASLISVLRFIWHRFQFLHRQ